MVVLIENLRKINDRTLQRQIDAWQWKRITKIDYSQPLKINISTQQKTQRISWHHHATQLADTHLKTISQKSRIKLSWTIRVKYFTHRSDERYGEQIKITVFGAEEKRRGTVPCQ